MPEKQPEIQKSSIVLLGSFNPQIFQPAWFAAEGLIQGKESKEAKIEIIHNEFVIFSLDWLRLTVTRDRFALETLQEPYYEVMRDLALGTFDILKHTPVSKLGINLSMHFKMNTYDEWHQFGHQLAPKKKWNQVLKKPGLYSLTIEGSVNRDNLKGFIRVKVEPSRPIVPGVFIDINDHYEVNDDNSAKASEAIMNILQNSWDRSIKRSKEIIYTLMEKK